MKEKNVNIVDNGDQINYKPIFIIIAILSILSTLLIDFYTPINYKKLMRISLFSLFLGIIIENYRISKSRRYLFYIFFGTYFLSLTWFLFNKENKIEQIIEYWPFYYIIIFLIVSVAVYNDKLVRKVTEGFTLIISLAFIYWLIEKNIFNFNNIINISITSSTLLVSAFSIFNSLSNVELTKSIRLFLSIWTTIILLVLSFDNIFLVFKNTDNINNHLSDNVFLGLQYFLLGISSVYTVKNIYMVYSLLDKDTRKKARIIHIERFSQQQVSILNSLICIAFSGIVYFANYQYNYISKNLIIWSVIFVFPFLLELIKFIKLKLK